MPTIQPDPTRENGAAAWQALLGIYAPLQQAAGVAPAVPAVGAPVDPDDFSRHLAAYREASASALRQAGLDDSTATLDRLYGDVSGLSPEDLSRRHAVVAADITSAHQTAEVQRQHDAASAAQDLLRVRKALRLQEIISDDSTPRALMPEDPTAAAMAPQAASAPPASRRRASFAPPLRYGPLGTRLPLQRWR